MSQSDMLPPGPDPQSPAEVVGRMRREGQRLNAVDAYFTALMAAHDAEPDLRAALAPLVDEVTERLLNAPREQFYGTSLYAVLLETATGTQIKLEPYPHLRDLQYIVDDGVSFVVLNCETTGLHPLNGDRIVSITGRAYRAGKRDGKVFVEPTGHSATFVVNPGRASTPQALAVHRLGPGELRGKPPFEDICTQFRRFLIGAGWYEHRHVDGTPAIFAHNAPFDMAFLDMECERAGGSRPSTQHGTIDTKALAKLLWPGAPSSLDALCERFGVDRGDRDARHESGHDVELLAKVLPYLLEEALRREPDSLNDWGYPITYVVI